MSIFQPVGFTTPPLDGDVINFINASGLSGQNQIFAINNLVINLKYAGLWTKMRALYPMVGGTANTHKYNLKDPRDLDAAYRLNFQGTWTHNSDGAKPNGVSGTYADTFLNPSTTLSQTNGHISYYSFTESAGENGLEIGQGFAGGADVGECLLAVRWGDNNFYGFWHHKAVSGGGGTTNNTSRGFYLVTRTTATTNFKNGSQTRTGGTGDATTGNFSFYLAAQNNGTTSYRNGSRGCSFSSIGDTLSASEAATFSRIVNTFQGQLKRYTY